MFPSHPLFRHFENELTIGEQKLEWTTRGLDFFFRPVGADVRLIWCEFGRGEMDAAVKNPTRLKRVQHRTAKNLALKRVRRFWPLDDERELALTTDSVLMRHKDADFWLRLGWQEPMSADELLFDADLPSIVPRLEPSAHEAWALITALLGDSMGQMHWFQCSRGDMEELKRVLWACLVLYGGSFYVSKSTDLLFRWLLQAPYKAREDRYESYQRVRNMLDAHFTLKWHPLSSRTCRAWGKPQKRPVVATRPSSAISEHEQLEAMLIWRDFLRDKLPPNEIASLLDV